MWPQPLERRGWVRPRRVRTAKHKAWALNASHHRNRARTMVHLGLGPPEWETCQASEERIRQWQARHRVHPRLRCIRKIGLKVGRHPSISRIQPGLGSAHRQYPRLIPAAPPTFRLKIPNRRSSPSGQGVPYYQRRGPHPPLDREPPPLLPQTKHWSTIPIPVG